MSQATAPIRHTDRFYIGGQWVAASSDATINVIDSGTEQVYFTVAEAQAADIDRAVTAAKEAFDNGPWQWLSHAQRADYLRALGAELNKRSDDIGQIWPRESGVLAAVARYGGAGADTTFSSFAALADTYQWEEPAKPSRPRCWLAAPWCSRTRPRRPARATCWLRRPKPSGCRPASSTWSPPTARYPSC